MNTTATSPMQRSPGLFGLGLNHNETLITDMTTIQTGRTARQSGERQCTHWPRCRGALAHDHSGARTIAGHPEQGWSLLCNGMVIFDDGGALLPDAGPFLLRRPAPAWSPWPPERPNRTTTLPVTNVGEAYSISGWAKPPQGTCHARPRLPADSPARR
jgi:Family of unknown function (DUF5999)